MWLCSTHSIQLTLYQVKTANTKVIPTQDKLAKSPPPPPKKTALGSEIEEAFGTRWGEEKCIWAFGEHT